MKQFGFFQKNKSKLIRYLLNLCAILAVWGNLLRRNYNSDTVFHMLEWIADVVTHLEDGRYINALSDYILLKLGIRTTDNIGITMLITFVILALAATLIQVVFEKWEPRGILLKLAFNVGISLAFFNVFFAEVLMFNDVCVYFALAYTLSAAGCLFYTHKKYVRALILLMLGVCTYQNAAVFAALVLVFYFLLEHEFKWSVKAILDELLVLISTFGMGLLNFLSIRLVAYLGVTGGIRKDMGGGNLIDNIKVAFSSLVLLEKSANGILPGIYLPLIFSVFTIFISTLILIKANKYQEILFYMMVIFGSLLMLFVIPMTYSEFRFPPRLSFLFYMRQGIMGAVFLYIADKYQISLPIGGADIRNPISVCIVLYAFIHCIFIGFITTDRFVSNTLDEVYSRELVREIEKYEEETGKTVKYLGTHNDDYSIAGYDEVTFKTDQINERVIGQATYSIIEVITGRHFDFVYMPDEIYDEYFAGHDWDYLDFDEQLVIKDDTAYWCIY